MNNSIDVDQSNEQITKKTSILDVYTVVLTDMHIVVRKMKNGLN